MDGINKIIKSLGNSGTLTDGVSKTLKHKIKKSERWICWSVIRNFR